MKFSVEALANLVGGVAEGNTSDEIFGLAEYDKGKSGEITFVVDKKKYEEALKTEVSAIIVPHDFDFRGKTLIRVDDPKFAIARIAELFNPYQEVGFKGISDKAYIGNNVNLGKNVTIMPFATIQDNVKIGDNAVIFSGVFIGYNSIIGNNVVLKSNVVIYPGTTIGNNVIIHAGSVVGSDGFGYVNREGTHYKIPHIGKVVIEDNVEIGANTCIDRAFIGETIIGKGTKIDNLVQIAHNVKIGKNTIIVSQAGIAGSTEIGNNVIIHAGSVVGSDGFGYVNKEGKHYKIPHIGRVVIEDDVEIGANTCIDRAFIGETVIGKGTKIDNLVQIAHNVKIGKNVILVSQAGIAGSTEIGNNVIIAGQAGIVDHAKIGDNVVIMAKAGVEDREVPPNKVLLGIPARDALEQKRIFVAETKLPELLKRVKDIEDRLRYGFSEKDKSAE